MAVRRCEISIRAVEKYFSSELGERVKYFSTREEKFRTSKRPCSVLFTIQEPMKNQTIQFNFFLLRKARFILKP